MTDQNERNGEKTTRHEFPKENPWRFKAGNSGRPKGTRNKSTKIAEVLLKGEAAAITRKCISMALAGNPVAMRLCMERILPPLAATPADLGDFEQRLKSVEQGLIFH